MKLTKCNFVEIHDVLVCAAQEAGDFISNYCVDNLKVIDKDAGENIASQVVTEVDFESQKIILEIVESLITKFDLALLTEESIDNGSRHTKDYFLSIDPLDGTLPFIEQKSGYAVSIALVSKDGVPYVSVVYDPLSKSMYSAIRNVGVLKSGEPFCISEIEPKEDVVTLVCDRSFLKQDRYSKIIDNLNSFLPELGVKNFEMISHGGAAMNAIWVLENMPALYFKFPKPVNGGGSLWDYAATALIFEELGLFVSDIYGKPLDLNREDSTFMNHRGVLYCTNETVKDWVINLYKNLS